MDARAESMVCGGLHYAMHHVRFGFNFSNRAAGGGKKQSGRLVTRPRDQDVRVTRRWEVAHERGVGRQPPRFRFSELLELFSPPANPRLIRRQSEPRSDDAIHFEP